jgi:RNA polymerase sigma-70 factor, ECF subfamily
MAQAVGVGGRVEGEFRRYFQESYDYLWRSLRRLGVQERDIEDVAHDVLLEVHAKFDRYDRSRPFRPWLFAFAVRFASDYRRLARHRTELRGDIDTSGTASTGEELLSDKDTARLVDAALESLSMELRAVIVLYEIDETPMKEVAETLGIPLNTAYSRLRLARARCAETIARAGGGGR